MKIIVDTSILIDNLRGGNELIALLSQIQKQNAQLFIPTIVIYELFAGQSTRKPEVRNIITALIKNFKRLELTEEIAKCAGILYRDTNQKLGPQDYIIAASALEIGGSVLTINHKHFSQIPNLSTYPL